MFTKEGLIANVVLAAIAGFLMNVAIFQLIPKDIPKEKELIAWCGTPDATYTLSNLGLEGKNLFHANCASCHAIYEKVVGPPLIGTFYRWPDRETLARFIKHPKKVIKSGKMPYATALYQKYETAGYMPQSDYLTDQDMEAILAFLQEING